MAEEKERQYNLRQIKQIGIWKILKFLNKRVIRTVYIFVRKKNVRRKTEEFNEDKKDVKVKKNQL